MEIHPSQYNLPNPTSNHVTLQKLKSPANPLLRSEPHSLLRAASGPAFMLH